MAIVNGYTTLAEVKAALRIPTADTVDDALIELSIEGASRTIDGVADRVFYKQTATRVFVPVDGFLVETDDFNTITSLKTASNADGVFDITWSRVTISLSRSTESAAGRAFRSLASRPSAISIPYLRPQDHKQPRGNGSGHGSFGWASVPTAIRQATLILAMRQFKRYDSPLGVRASVTSGLFALAE
jgi:hypothetical protein